MILTLSRVIHLDRGTFGTLNAVGMSSRPFFTAERPWLDNQKNVSCIPTGNYKIVPRRVGSFYKRYHDRWGHEFSLQLEPTGHRDTILLHVGNNPMNDCEGCILLGEGCDNTAVTNSRKAYQRFYDLVAADVKRGECHLTVIAPDTGPTDEADLDDREDL